MRYLIGVDEAGRGPLAGPVSVGAVMVPASFNWAIAGGVRDSKQLTPETRHLWYKKMLQLRRDGMLQLSVSFSSAQYIDHQGIAPAIRRAVANCLRKLDADPRTCEIRLDGSLYAPEIYEHQSTIIGGDDCEPVISLASIVAKVRRDRLMTRLALRYPDYEFDSHKGYGTLKHQALIREHGLCELHRATFCTRILGLQNSS